MRRRGRGLGCVAAVAGLTFGAVAALPVNVWAVTQPGPAVVVGCFGLDQSATGSQIRVGLVVSGADGLYRAVFSGPDGPVQGEGRVAGERGLVIVPSSGAGTYDDLVLTNVDTGQAIDRGPLGDALPLAVDDAAIACDPAALVVPTGESTPAATPAPTDATVAPASDPTGVPTPDISTAAPLATSAERATTDTPPWLLLAIPGVLLVIGGVVLLVRARSGSRSRPAT